MIHILHLPVFPEGSDITPDAISELLFDQQTSDDVAHIVIRTDDHDTAIAWTKEFLDKNPQIPRDEVTLTYTRSKRYHIYLLPWLSFVEISLKSDLDVVAFYKPRVRVAQEVIPAFF